MEATNSKPVTVLLIEDHEEIARMYKSKLIFNGFAVIHAVNGKEGIESVKKALPDIIVLDLLMPEVDGFEVLKTLNSLINNTPVIVLSNVNSMQQVEFAMDLGAREYLVKAQTTPSDLVAKVKAMLGI